MQGKLVDCSTRADKIQNDLDQPNSNKKNPTKMGYVEKLQETMLKVHPVAQTGLKWKPKVQNKYPWFHADVSGRKKGGKERRKWGKEGGRVKDRHTDRQSPRTNSLAISRNDWVFGESEVIWGFLTMPCFHRSTVHTYIK